MFSLHQLLAQQSTSSLMPNNHRAISHENAIMIPMQVETRSNQPYCRIKHTLSPDDNTTTTNNNRSSSSSSSSSSGGGSDNELEYHCSSCNAYKDATDFFPSCIRRKARYCKRCFKLKFSSKKKPLATSTSNIDNAKKVLQRLRRHCAQTKTMYGKQTIVFNVATTRKLLQYWQTQLKNSPSSATTHNSKQNTCKTVVDMNNDVVQLTDMSFVIWQQQHAGFVLANDVVPFKTKDARILMDMPLGSRQSLFSSEVKDDINRQLAGVNDYIISANSTNNNTI